MAPSVRTYPLRRLLILVLVLALLAGGLALGISAYVVSSTQDRILSREDAPPEDLDCILVLGCGIRPDGSPTPMLRDRILTGTDLYQEAWSDRLLMSGDNSREDYNEVGTMQAVAMDLGVPREAIVTDHAGFSTYDSIYRARDVFSARRMVIVTQAYHLPRALYLAEALGLEAWGIPADTRRYAGQLARDLREILARDKDFVTALLQPAPKLLGESVPLEGN